MDQRLADIGVDMAGQAAEPGLHRIDAFAQAGEAQAVDDPFDGTDLLVRTMAIGVRNRDGRGEIAEGDMVAAGCFCACFAFILIPILPGNDHCP